MSTGRSVAKEAQKAQIEGHRVHRRSQFADHVTHSRKPPTPRLQDKIPEQWKKRRRNDNLISMNASKNSVQEGWN